jgi:hypothetical protein
MEEESRRRGGILRRLSGLPPIVMGRGQADHRQADYKHAYDLQYPDPQVWPAVTACLMEGEVEMPRLLGQTEQSIRALTDYSKAFCTQSPAR